MIGPSVSYASHHGTNGHHNEVANTIYEVAGATIIKGPMRIMMRVITPSQSSRAEMQCVVLGTAIADDGYKQYLNNKGVIVCVGQEPHGEWAGMDLRSKVQHNLQSKTNAGTRTTSYT